MMQAAAPIWGMGALNQPDDTLKPDSWTDSAPLRPAHMKQAEGSTSQLQQGSLVSEFKV